MKTHSFWKSVLCHSMAHLFALLISGMLVAAFAAWKSPDFAYWMGANWSCQRWVLLLLAANMFLVGFWAAAISRRQQLPAEEKSVRSSKR